VLVYSGQLLVPAGRLRPEDIVAYKPVGGAAVSFGVDPLSGGMAPFPYFPENDTVLQIRDVLDAKVGFDLLVVGTTGSVAAIIAGALTRPWNVPFALGIASAVVVFAIGYGAGWWATHGGWRGKQERRLLAQCFLAWLEGAVADWKTKGQDFGLSVVGTARRSRFTLIDEGADDKAIAQWVIALAHKHHYDWRTADFRKWAGNGRPELKGHFT
jgi:hypothetical protein